MTSVKTVIFDMDGLMFDTEPIYYKANQKTADYLEMDFSFDTYAQFIGMGDKDYKKTMQEIYKDEELLTDFFAKSNKVLDYLFLNGDIEMKKGLVKLLEYLKENNISAVVASSSHRKLVEKLLDRLSVKEYFKAIVAGNEVKEAKPDPEIFNKAFEKTGVENKNEALVLEDSKNGVLAASSADIPVIMIPDMIEADEEVIENTVEIFSDLNGVITYIENKVK